MMTEDERTEIKAVMIRAVRDAMACAAIDGLTGDETFATLMYVMAKSVGDVRDDAERDRMIVAVVQNFRHAVEAARGESDTLVRNWLPTSPRNLQ